MMVSFFVLSFFPRGVLDEILNLIESVSELFSSYSYIPCLFFFISLLSLFWTVRKEKQPDMAFISAYITLTLLETFKNIADPVQSPQHSASEQGL